MLCIALKALPSKSTNITQGYSKKKPGLKIQQLLEEKYLKTKTNTHKNK